MSHLKEILKNNHLNQRGSTEYHLNGLLGRRMNINTKESSEEKLTLAQKELSYNTNESVQKNEYFYSINPQTQGSTIINYTTPAV